MCMSSSGADSAEVSRKSWNILDQGGALFRALDSLWGERKVSYWEGEQWGGALAAVWVKGGGGVQTNGAY